MPHVIIAALINLERSHFNKFCASIIKNILVIIAVISQMPKTTSLPLNNGYNYNKFWRFVSRKKLNVGIHECWFIRICDNSDQIEDINYAL